MQFSKEDFVSSCVSSVAMLGIVVDFMELSRIYQDLFSEYTSPNASRIA